MDIDDANFVEVDTWVLCRHSQNENSSSSLVVVNDGVGVSLFSLGLWLLFVYQVKVWMSSLC